MLSKTITYTDYNGTERTETYLFNLSKAELMEMEMGKSGGYAEYLRKIASSQDAPEMMRVFKELLLKAYGEKSDDGKRFIKSSKLSEAFSQTEAYSELFMELVTNTDAISDFVNGIIPADLGKQASAPVIAPAT